MDRMLQAITLLVTVTVSKPDPATTKAPPFNASFFPAPFYSPIQPPKLPVIVMPLYSQMKDDEEDEQKVPSENCTDTDVSDTDTDYLNSDESDSEDDSARSGSDGGWWQPNKNHKKLKGWVRRKSRRSGTVRGNLLREPRKFHRHSKDFRRKNRRSGTVQEPKYQHYIGHLTPLLQYVTKDGYVISEQKLTDREAEDWLENDKVPDSPDTQDEVDNILEKQIDNLIQEAKLELNEEYKASKVESDDNESEPTTTQKSKIKINLFGKAISRRKANLEPRTDYYL